MQCMKTNMLILLSISSTLFGSTFETGKIKGLLVCQSRASYGIRIHGIKIDLESVGASIGKNHVVLDWSDSECEDASKLQLRKQDYEGLKDGTVSSFDGHYWFSEPEMKVSTLVTCTLVSHQPTVSSS